LSLLFDPYLTTPTHPVALEQKLEYVFEKYYTASKINRQKARFVTSHGKLTAKENSIMTTRKSGAEQDSIGTKSTQETSKPNLQAFTKAYAEWVQQQQEVSLAYQRRCHEAYFELVSDLNEIATAGQRPLEDAQLKLKVAGATANIDQESRKNYEQLQQEFARVQMEVNNDPKRQESCQKAYNDHLKATQEALEEAQNRNLKAYQRYLKVVQDGWSQFDIEKLDPADMRALEWSTKAAFQSGMQ
jgi:hypothetical protein